MPTPQCVLKMPTRTKKCNKVSQKLVYLFFNILLSYAVFPFRVS